eukprot:6221382-Amphidinium_carterae.1
MSAIAVYLAALILMLRAEDRTLRVKALDLKVPPHTDSAPKKEDLYWFRCGSWICFGFGLNIRAHGRKQTNSSGHLNLSITLSLAVFGNVLRMLEQEVLIKNRRLLVAVMQPKFSSGLVGLAALAVYVSFSSEVSTNHQIYSPKLAARHAARQSKKAPLLTNALWMML